MALMTLARMVRTLLMGGNRPFVLGRNHIVKILLEKSR